MVVPICELLLGISLRPPSDIVHEDVRFDHRRHEVINLVPEDRLIMKFPHLLCGPGIQW